MIGITYTNSKGVSLAIPGTDYFLSQLRGIENTQQDVFLQKSPGINGAQYIGSLYTVREITAECATSSGSIAEMYTRRIYLNTVINDQNAEGSLQIDVLTSTGTKSYQIACLGAKILFASKDVSIPALRFQITFKCANPFYNILPQKTQSLGITTPLLTFPLTFPTMFSSSTGSNVATISNAGNADAPLLITVTGPATNPVITNNTTGEYLQFQGLTLGVGQVLIIRTGRITQIEVDTGTGDNNGFQFLTLGSTFFSLRPGNNEIAITDDLSFQYGSCLLSWYDQQTGI